MHKIKMLSLVVGFGLSAAVVGCDDKADAKADTKVAKADDKNEKAGGDDGDKADDKKEEGGEEPAAEGGEEPAAEGGGGGDNVLVGSWELDPESFKEMDDYKNAPDDQKKMMEAMLGSMKMDLTFTDDSMKLDMAMGEKKESKEGKYSVKSNEAGTIVIESEVDGKKEEISVTVDGDKLTMQKDKDKMVFKKKG